MPHTESKIEVDVPVRTAYDQWTQFESFPAFMKGVKSVRQLSENRLQWSAEIGGKDVQWTAEITHQEPDRHIGWRIDSEPEGAVEKTGSALGVVSHRIEADVEKFKQFIEQRGAPTGAWRGEIRQGRVASEGGAGE